MGEEESENTLPVFASGTVEAAVADRLQSQIDLLRTETNTLKRTTTDLQVDLRTGINSVRSMCEHQYSQLDTKIDTQFGAISIFLQKIEEKQEEMSETIQKQIGAEEERERARRQRLDDTHQKAEEAAIETESLRKESERLHHKLNQRKLKAWPITLGFGLFCTLITALIAGVLRSPTVDHDIQRELMFRIQRLEHKNEINNPPVPYQLKPQDDGDGKESGSSRGEPVNNGQGNGKKHTFHLIPFLAPENNMTAKERTNGRKSD